MENEKPPILGNWRNMYTAVLIIHLLVILLLTYITYIYR